jgi:hypothetical protein
MYGTAVLVAVAAMVLTWRFLVSRLWIGLSGKRPLFVGSVVSIVVLVIASLVLDAGRLPGWLLADPARLSPLVWLAAGAVVAKCGIAAYAWRGVGPRYLRAYLLAWLAATTLVVVSSVVLWGIVRTYVPPLDNDRARSLVILIALLVVPLARVGFAPFWLARNRHRGS